jgi:arylsulfatase A-like enzyme
VRILVAALCVAVSLFSSCSSREGPIAIIGVDGLEWDVALPLIRQGRMPTIEGLMRRGSFGLLSTQSPAKSPRIWTTVVTGKAPSKHGILDFTRPGANGYQVEYTSNDRTTKALWNIFTDAGKRSVVLGWWNTFPVEAISGVMVYQINTLEWLRSQRRSRSGGMESSTLGQVYPTSREAEIFEIVERVDRRLPELVNELYPEAASGNSPADTAKWKACSWSIRADYSVRDIALRLTRTEPFPDLLMAYFGSTDVFGHHFWRYHAPQDFRHPPSADRVEKLGGVLSRTYEQVDAMIGELLAEMPGETTVFILSDHGMEAKHTNAVFGGRANGGAERESGGHGNGPPGVLVVAGPPIRRSPMADRVNHLDRQDLVWLGDVDDITPTILALHGLPIGRDMDGVILENILRPEFSAFPEPTYIDTHDTAEWTASRSRSGDLELPGHEERLEQLRSLGYLEESSEEHSSEID